MEIALYVVGAAVALVAGIFVALAGAAVLLAPKDSDDEGYL